MPFRRSYTEKQARWMHGLVVSAVVVQLLVASASIVLMAAVRTVVGGESFWFKGVSSSIMHLERYAVYGGSAEYAAFREAITIPLSVQQARDSLDTRNNDRTVIEQGLLRGENHPEDVRLLMWVLPWVWHSSYLAPTLDAWRHGDRYLRQLDELANTIYEHRNSDLPVTNSDIALWQGEIASVFLSITPLAKQFNVRLASNARDLAMLLLVINLLTACTLVTLYTMVTRRGARESAQAYAALEAERERSSITLAALTDGVIALDAHLTIKYVNPAAVTLLGMGKTQLKNQTLAAAVPELAKHLHELTDDDAHKKNNSDDIRWIERPGLPAIAVRIACSHLQLNTAATGYVLVLHDVSQEQHFKDQLAWQQNHDLLTGLDNRATFAQRVEKILGQHTGSLLHLNLDHFKMINATFGHDAGDEILRQVCQQLQLALRESDILARVGGDEFAVLLDQCTPHAAMHTAERLRKRVHQLQVAWEQQLLHTGVSIGVVHIPLEGPHNVQALLGMADSACKHAKDSGRNRITVYSAHNQAFQRHTGDMEWVQRLRASLDDDRFCLYAQTVYPLSPPPKGHGGIHFEVLLRLQDEFDKPVAPSDFIPIAERYDLMPQIDRWVVRNTLKLLKAHLARGAQIGTCAINLSGTSLGDSELLDFIRQSILEQGVAPEKLCFEVTETSAIANMDNAISLIEELRRMGCRFALDDFGSGMASFKYLQQLPVDYLKIDGSFVRDMLKQPSNHAMVEAINHIGHVMNKRTVAEFVGDQATMEALQALGVDYAQGYYIAQPVPLDAAFFEMAVRPPPQQSPSLHPAAPIKL